MALRRFEHTSATSLGRGGGAPGRAPRGKPPSSPAARTSSASSRTTSTRLSRSCSSTSSAIDGLRYVKEDKKGLRIGALTTLAELATHKAIREKYPLLAERRTVGRLAADPQHGHHRRQPLPGAALLVLPRPRERLPLPAQGRREVQRLARARTATTPSSGRRRRSRRRAPRTARHTSTSRRT